MVVLKFTFLRVGLFTLSLPLVLLIAENSFNPSTFIFSRLNPPPPFKDGYMGYMFASGMPFKVSNEIIPEALAVKLTLSRNNFISLQAFFMSNESA